MKKIPFNYKIALENPKAVVKTKDGNLVTDLTYNGIVYDPYLLVGYLHMEGVDKIIRMTWKLNGHFSNSGNSNNLDLELYVPFTSLWDRIKYYLKKSNNQKS